MAITMTIADRKDWKAEPSGFVSVGRVQIPNSPEAQLAWSIAGNSLMALVPDPLAGNTLTAPTSLDQVEAALALARAKRGDESRRYSEANLELGDGRTLSWHIGDSDADRHTPGTRAAHFFYKPTAGQMTTIPYNVFNEAELVAWIKDKNCRTLEEFQACGAALEALRHPPG